MLFNANCRIFIPYMFYTLQWHTFDHHFSKSRACHADIYGRWSYEISQTKTWLGHLGAKQSSTRECKGQLIILRSWGIWGQNFWKVCKHKHGKNMDRDIYSYTTQIMALASKLVDLLHLYNVAPREYTPLSTWQD